MSGFMVDVGYKRAISQPSPSTNCLAAYNRPVCAVLMKRGYRNSEYSQMEVQCGSSKKPLDEFILDYCRKLR